MHNRRHHSPPSSRSAKSSTSLSPSQRQKNHTTHHQQRRQFRVNQPKGFHDSLYGGSMNAKALVEFQSDYARDKKQLQRRYGLEDEVIDQDNIVLAVGEGVVSTKGGSDVMVFDEFLIHSGNTPLSITHISPSQLKDKRILLRSDLDVQYEMVAVDAADSSNETGGASHNLKLQVTPNSMLQLANLVPTVQYLIDSGAQVILSSSKPKRHKNVKDGEKFDGFQPIATALSELLNKGVTFVSKPLENDAQSIKKALSLPSNDNEIILLDNLSIDQAELTDKDHFFHGNRPAPKIDFSEKILDAINPALCVYDIMPLRDSEPSLRKLTQHAKKRSIPSVVGMLVAKELTATKEVYKALQHVTAEGRALQASLAQQKSKKLQKNALTPHQYTSDLAEFGQDNAKLGQRFTKTLLMGSESFSDLIPALRTSFETTQNFIFSNRASFGMAHATHLADVSMQSQDPEIYHEMIDSETPVAFGDEAQNDTGSAMIFLANAAKSGKSVWLPHDWLLTNPLNPAGRKVSASTLQMYEAGFKGLRVVDIGVSTRKDFRWAVDNIIAQQLEGKNQLLFWFGSMSPLSSSQSNDGNDAIIEALHKATDAGVITVVGGNEVLEAIARYNTNAPKRLAQMTANERASASQIQPKFSFVSSSPSAISALLAGESVFGDFEQEKH